MGYSDCARKLSLRPLIFVFFFWPLSVSAEFRFESKTASEAIARPDKTPINAESSGSKSGWRISQSYSRRVDNQPSIETTKSSVDGVQNTSLIAPISAKKFSQVETISSQQPRPMGLKGSGSLQSLQGLEAAVVPDAIPLKRSTDNEVVSFQTTDQSDTECSDFQFSEGLLKANLDRLLRGCGFTIGRWGIGDEEYEYDIEIPKAYLLKRKGIVELLESVEASYLIRGTRNKLDSTVDFEPSRGAILEGMEIKEW